MNIKTATRPYLFIGLLSAIGIALGWAFDSFLMYGTSVVGICAFISHIWRPRSRSETPARTQPQPVPARPVAAKKPRPPKRRASGDSSDQALFVDEMIDNHRYALLLRPQIIDNLTADQLERTLEQFRYYMSAVPAGNVKLAQPELSVRIADGAEPAHAQEVAVEAIFLDRFAVSNEQYQQFIDAGGYDHESLWDPEILPAVREFVDASGQRGPRFWNNGTFPSAEADHPVVGISWFEASAYATWVGKRLPRDSEWAKAAIWPVSVGGRLAKQRKYPWGHDFSPERANLWCTGQGGTVAVDEFGGGVSAGDAYQLTGNVWEWVDDDFGEWVPPERPFESPQPLKAVRGGAFDTFFEHQAVCQFQSADSPLSRKHNIGFRCAIYASEIASTAQAQPSFNNSTLASQNVPLETQEVALT